LSAAAPVQVKPVSAAPPPTTMAEGGLAAPLWRLRCWSLVYIECLICEACESPYYFEVSPNLNTRRDVSYFTIILHA
jgi:hypothetical protein